MNKTIIIVSGVIIIMLAIAGYKFFPRFMNQAEPIPSKGGEEFSLTNTISSNYLQRDSRWSEETLGGSEESIGSVGCTICSVANALTALGYTLNPSELNDYLKNNAGYNSRGWLIWSKVPHVNISVFSEPSHTHIDSAIRKGNYPIIKFWIGRVIPHWVTIVGKEGLDYLVLDPRYEGVRKLSSLTENIYSLRIVINANKPE